MTTKLTPRTPEQCDLIDERARQEKAGELDAGYWYWHWGKSKSYFLPAPVHPHYATYCEWQRLIDAGEVAKGWWVLGHPAKAFLEPAKNPLWQVDMLYEIGKTDKHPDNCKPALKLIDWANMPAGTMTTCGEILAVRDKVIYFTSPPDGAVLKELSTDKLYFLRLAPQTKFTHLQNGEEPPVIKGVMIEYEYCGEFGRTVDNHYEKSYTTTCIGYRIIGLADGWTDDPAKAAP